MSALSNTNCEICNKTSIAANDLQSEQWLQELPGWKIIHSEGMPHLLKRYQFKNFNEALNFTNKIGEIAEQENHHPKLCTEWGSVEVQWWTHSIGGLHKNDFIMAAKTELQIQ